MSEAARRRLGARKGRRSAGLSLVRPLVCILILLAPFLAAAQNLDEPFGPQQDIWGFTGEVFRLGIFLIIIAAAIFIAIGAYFYFLAAGNAEMAKTGMEYIQRSIIGLILGLLAFIILQTISPQFVRDQGGGPGGPRRAPGAIDPIERPQPNPAIADPNVADLGGARLLTLEQTGPAAFRFDRDANPQVVARDGVLQRVDSLLQQGTLRRGDGVMLSVPQNVALTPDLYAQLGRDLSARGLTLSVPRARPR